MTKANGSNRMTDKAGIYEDVWIPTQCARCYGACGILMRRVNGVAVKIEGNPGSSMGGGGRFMNHILVLPIRSVFNSKLVSLLLVSHPW